MRSKTVGVTLEDHGDQVSIADRDGDSTWLARDEVELVVPWLTGWLDEQRAKEAADGE